MQIYGICPCVSLLYTVQCVNYTVYLVVSRLVVRRRGHNCYSNTCDFPLDSPSRHDMLKHTSFHLPSVPPWCGTGRVAWNGWTAETRNSVRTPLTDPPGNTMIYHVNTHHSTIWVRINIFETLWRQLTQSIYIYTIFVYIHVCDLPVRILQST